MRIVAGAMFAFHGVQKVFRVLTDHAPAIGTQLWVGGIIELVAGAAIAVGLFTSCAAFIASGTMAVAYLQFHWKFQFGASFFPAINKGELLSLSIHCLPRQRPMEPRSADVTKQVALVASLDAFRSTAQEAWLVRLAERGFGCEQGVVKCVHLALADLTGQLALQLGEHAQAMSDGVCALLGKANQLRAGIARIHQ
ncbi:MAG TPA: DoxX family protein [Polyangiaceae bacterium]|nr:DoxX family protein [Polyangiaceae bacterium]